MHVLSYIKYTENMNVLCKAPEYLPVIVQYTTYNKNIWALALDLL